MVKKLLYCSSFLKGFTSYAHHHEATYDKKQINTRVANHKKFRQDEIVLSVIAFHYHHMSKNY